jgi:hypothetical protein
MNAQDISAGVRTVTHAANYFDELKAKAAALAQSRAAQDRGYFSPNEEDQVRGVLISYWQARNALLELITSFRLDTQLSDEDRPAAFLTAFAGALVLIDGARFLRETVHERPLVREKLNEAAPQFGIPAGVYDAIQRSLIGARNAWHLYHAIRYFEEHERQLREMAREAELAPVMDVIERLRHRLDISATQFARARLRMRAAQAYRSLLSDALAKALYGLQKLGGNMLSDQYVRRGHQPALPEEIATRVRSLLNPGDVLVVRKEYALTNYFLPGYWPHAALYLGDVAALSRLGIQDQDHVRPRWLKLLEGDADEPGRVLESMKDGVQIRTLDSPFGSDSIVVLRPRMSASEIAQGLARVMAHEGKPYDFDFDFRRSDRLVCTEVVYRAYDGVGGMQFPLVQRAGRPTLSGSDLIGMAIERRSFDPVAVFIPGGELALGESVMPILRAKLGEPIPATVSVEPKPAD